MGWRLWPVISAEFRRGEGRPRYFWAFHVPLVAVFVAALWIPTVQRWSGVHAPTATVLLGAHLIFVSCYVHTGVFDRVPVIWSTLAATLNLGLLATISASTARPGSPLWSLELLYVMLAAQAFGQTVYFLALAVAAPLAVAAVWHLSGAVPLSEGAGPMAVVSFLSAVSYLFLARMEEEQRRARRELEEERQRAAVDRERSRIARELHGTIGAALTEISLWQGVATATNDAEALRRASRRTREGLLELRACVATMDGAESSVDTLVTLIHARLDGLCDAAKVALAVDFASEVAVLPADHIYHAAKIVEEAVLNAVRHGRPRHLQVRVRVSAESALTLDVVDDGVGFDPAAVPPGRGLRSMGEHTEALGASMTLESSRDAGARVTVRTTEGAPS